MVRHGFGLAVMGSGAAAGTYPEARRQILETSSSRSTTAVCLILTLGCLFHNHLLAEVERHPLASVNELLQLKKKITKITSPPLVVQPLLLQESTESEIM